jgi:hypothetical protein
MLQRDLSPADERDMHRILRVFGRLQGEEESETEEEEESEEAEEQGEGEEA